MIQINRIPCGNVNCFIVVKGDNAILVDTGKEEYQEKILSVCNKYPIRLIVLTHGHIDHVQNTAYLKQKLQVPVAMSKADLSLLENNTSQELYADGLLGKLMLSFSKKSFFKDKIPAFIPDIFLNEGDTLVEYGIPATVISLQGHTKGSIGLDIENKFLLVGDALMNMFYPCCALLYNQKREAQESAKKITNMGNRTIYFGHGKSTKNRVWCGSK